MNVRNLTLIFFVFVLLLPRSLSGQMQKPGLPPSFQAINLKSQIKLPEGKLKKLDIATLLKEDEEFPTPLRYAIHEELNIDVRKAGYMTQLPKGKIWRYTIDGGNAKALGLYFKEYHLPPGAELYMYNEDKSYMVGAFTDLNNKTFGSLTIADFPYDHCIIEYYEPENAAFSGKLSIGSVAKAYRDIGNVLAGGNEQLAPYLVDVNCTEGDNVQLQKHAVARITFRIGRQNYLCSGSLVNNTEFNGIPYFLTANHCLSTDSVAQNVVAYFNYETEQCGGIAIVSPNKTISGARLKATRSVSDFTLLQLSQTPDASYKPYYAGWTIKDIAPRTSYSIHHPSGAVKKISVDLDSATSYPFQINWEGQEISPANSHWQVIFDVGLTEGGSSGSPLFNQENKIVGQLHGGSEGVDYYGKLSVSWEGLFTTRALKFWLDPNDTGIEELEGYIPEGIKPDAHFSASLQNACVDAPVQLSDKSAFKPTTWEWAITPESVSYIDGTNENSQNPIVEFDRPGIYSVSLLASNKVGYNLQTFEDFIVAGNEIAVSYLLSAQQNICFSNFSDYEILAFGADTFDWELISPNAQKYFRIDTRENTAIVNINETAKIDTSLQASILLIGQHGSCMDTAMVGLNLLYPFNDFISNAFPLSQGLNGPFSNECATVQENEPIPPFGDCNSQYSWCDEYRDGTRIVENSLWFTFSGPQSGVVAVETDGFDNQIAIYEAENYQDIISGNTLLYRVVAANDDHLDEDYSATITQAKVIPGKKYWLQMDGSQGGQEGIFTVELFDSPITSSANSIFSNDVQLYPNPGYGKIYINAGEQFADMGTNVLISISALDGKNIYRQWHQTGSEEMEIDLSSVVPGVYIVHVSNDNKYYTTKLIIEK